MRNKTRRFDKASKEILKGKNIRAGIVKYLIDDYKHLSIDTIKSLMSEPLPTTDKSVLNKEIKYDVMFTVKLPNSKDKVGIYIDLEPQGYYLTDAKIMHRAIYYSARMIDRQKNDIEKGFEADHYEDLKKVYSVWIITDDRSPNKRRGKRKKIEFNASGDKEIEIGKEAYDLIEIDLIYPSLKVNKEQEDIVRLLSIVFNGSKDIKEKKSVLKSNYQIEIDDKEEEAMWGFLDERDDEIKAELKKVKLEGIAEGKTLGIAEERINLIKSLMEKNNYTLEQALDLFDFSDEEREEITKQIL